MAEDILIPNQIILGEHLYAQAIDLVLSKAERRVLIFDQDLSHGNFASVARYDLLHHCLSANIAAELCIILHDSHYFLQKCPRLNNLLRAYPHKMSIHLTDNSVKNFKSCFVVVDGLHYVKRIHIDQARFKFGFDEKMQTEILHQQFLELQAAAPYRISSITLGL